MQLIDLIRLCNFNELWHSLETDFHEKPFWRDTYRALHAHLSSPIAKPGEDALMLTSMPAARLAENSGVRCDWDSDAYIVGQDIYCALGVAPLDLTLDLEQLTDDYPARILARHLFEMLHWGGKR
ncbi:MAG: hypothetical protein LBI19_00775 [Oscillospiraceae bacterium]|jgi:hypothetical protein|nr:hypothetical protein [Oscillospiraceae bacterium]